MNSTLIGLATLACVLVGYAFGAYLKWRLPERQVGDESRETIKQTIAVIGTVTGMCLGLLVASSKGSFDEKAEGLNRMAVSIIVLDRALAHYGAEAAGLRAKLRAVVEGRRNALWQEGALKTEFTGSPGAVGAIESFQDALRELRPVTEAQRAIHAQATDIGNQIAATRWQVYVRSGTTVPPLFLAVLVFWQAAMFAGLGLVASRNPVDRAAIFVGAVAVSAAIYLILALDTPYEGLIRISDAPLRLVLEQLGK